MTDINERIGLLAQRINCNLIIDVGVAYGTPLLYSFWPDAYLALIEPNPVFHEYLESTMIASGRGSLFKYAASLCESEVLLESKLDGSSIIANSFCREQSPNKLLAVKARTLDSIVNELLQKDSRVVLKTDCQGHDYGVLLGASNTLQYCEAVIIEAHVYPWAGSERNHISNIVSIMNSRDFCLYDIVDPLYRPHDLALAQVDVVFVPRTSNLVSYQGF
jgi:FkbM family methyltransferase